MQGAHSFQNLWWHRRASKVAGKTAREVSRSAREGVVALLRINWPMSVAETMHGKHPIIDCHGGLSPC